MNCLEFRRETLADPRRPSAQAKAHAGSCPSCRTFALHVERTEDKLRDAMNVPVPDGLDARVLLARRRTARLPLRLFALAASVVLTVGLLLAEGQLAPGPNYARYAIDHMAKEPFALTRTAAMDPEPFHRALERMGGTVLLGSVGSVVYFKLCPVPGGFGWHVVLDTPYGIATVILIPQGPEGPRVITAAGEGWNARARAGGLGHYAVVADSAEHLENVDRLLLANLRWQG